MSYNGRYPGASPATEFVALSGSSASSPAILITATAAGSAVTIHTAGASAYDVLYVQVTNNSGGTLVAYGQFGSTATNVSVPLSLSNNETGFIANAVPLSGSGVFGIWTTATTGLVAYGSVARTYA